MLEKLFFLSGFLTGRTTRASALQSLIFLVDANNLERLILRSRVAGVYLIKVLAIL